MKIKRIVAFASALMLVVSFTACGTDSISSESTAGQSSAVLSTAGATESKASSPYLCSDKKVTLSAFIAQQPNGMTNITTNAFTLWMEEQTNVHLDMNVVQADGAKEKLVLMLASGDYPEIICYSDNKEAFSNADLVRYGSKEKILVPLNDLIEKYGTNLKQRWAENSEIKSDMTALDGNIYGIPSLDAGGIGHGQCGIKLWMNMDWLKKLNMKVPTTTEEFQNVLMAFKTKDPNGNGKQDEIPLTGAINTWSGDPYIFLLNAFDYFDIDNDKLLKLQNGKISFSANTEGFKEGLKYIAGLYKDGLIDPAAFTQNEQQLAAIGNNKDVAIGGSATCGHLGMFTDVSNVALTKQYDNILPLQGPSGYRAIPYKKMPSTNGAAFMITDKCKNQEVAMKWADLFCNENIILRAATGIQGKQWDVADPGTFAMDGKTPAKYKYLAGYNTSSGATDENDRWGWALKLVEPNMKNMFEVQGDIYDPTNYEARLYRCTAKLLPFAAKVDQLPNFWMSDDDSAKMNTLFTALKDYVKTSIVEFVTGRKDVDKDWNTYISGLSKLRYEDYVKLNQNAYNAIKK